MNTTLVLISLALVAGTIAPARAEPTRRETEQQLLHSLELRPEQLKPLALETTLVADAEPRAVICHADAGPWREAAVVVRQAVTEATGVELPLVSDGELTYEEFDRKDVVLLGNLDNNRHVARLYHNFFVCLDVGYTGRQGYVIRSVHDPFGAGHNAILVGGSYGEGTKRAAKAFADIVRQRGRRGRMAVGRLLELRFDDRDRQATRRAPLTDVQRDKAIAAGRQFFATAGLGRAGVARMLDYGVRCHRFGDPGAGQVYRALLLALMDYYATDEYIKAEGLARYDRDFRDSWTHSVCITYDLLEESGLFSDAERLRITNFLIRLGLECVLYQGWNRPKTLAGWRSNTDIVHNHNTFPALGVLFVGNYMKRHYGATFVDDWLAVAHGIFNGQKHCSKPLEDAASYQWLPLLHTIVYSLAEGDMTLFEEGHARQAAKVAMMVMDNAGYQAAFGDHSAYKASSGIGSLLQRVAWYYKDAGALWGARRAVGGIREHSRDTLGQAYFVGFSPRPPRDQRGVLVSMLPKPCYDYAAHSPQYPTAPNLPYEQTFDKLTLRAGFDCDDEYLLLDGFGRGTHMHFDANAIIRYAAGCQPLLVDGEYIKNAPKYHNSVVILRDGRSELTPAVAGLLAAEDRGETAFARTFLTEYNGARWTRSLIQRKRDYLLVVDEIEALEAGEYALRCCWRPWGEARLDDSTLTVLHSPMRLTIVNADGARGRLETMKVVERLPVSRYSQQVSLTMHPGDRYRFVNLIHAEPETEKRELRVRIVSGDRVVVEQEDHADVVSLLDGRPERRSSASVASLPTVHPPAIARSASAPSLPVRWRHEGLEPAPAPLPIAGATCPQPHAGKYGPVSRLVDGRVSSSLGSVMWPAGVAPTVTVELREPVEVSRVVLREWHMNEGWDIGRRKLEISTDGFARDVRAIAAPFRKTGTQRWGGNVNTLMAAEVGQRAQQLRLTLSPARPETHVYLAEVEVLGHRTGARPAIRAMAVGRLSHGRSVVIGADSGEVRALDGDGQPLWSFVTEGRSAVNAIACVDVDGDGRDEVVYGADNEQLGLLSAEGKERWRSQPPPYRGIRADVMTVFGADVDGDGKPEVVCGCKNWQYCTYDAGGEMLWRNIIYAHSATVGCAADFDRDGKDEVVGGNAYYTLNLIDHDGKRLFNVDRFGPEQTAAAAGDVNGDGAPEVLIGTDGGELVCFDRGGRRLWTQNVGDKVTRILPVDLDGDGVLDLVCSAESASVFAFDGKGEKLWRAALPDGAGDLALVPAAHEPRFVVACGSAGLRILNAAGRAVSSTPTEGRAQTVVVVGHAVVASTDRGVVQAFAMSK